MAKKRRKVYDDDDGRTISNMNVEGMPWYSPKASPSADKENSQDEKIKLTKREELALMWGVLKASLLVAGIFVVAFTIFILFCIFVWFK